MSDILSAQNHDAPGIGFDLTPPIRVSESRIMFSSGFSNLKKRTALVHYYNGTVVEVAYIQGNPEYLDLMMRLADNPRPRSDRTKRPLYESIFSRVTLSGTTSWGAWWRWLNKNSVTRSKRIAMLKSLANYWTDSKFLPKAKYLSHLIRLRL